MNCELQIKKQGLSLIVIAFIVALLLGGGYFVYQYFLKSQLTCWPYCPGMTDQDRENIKKSALEAEMKDWKTYHDEEYGLEFKYPGNWKLKNSQDNSAVRILIISSPEFDASEQGKVTTFRVFKTRLHKSLQDLNDAIIKDAKVAGIENSNIKIIGGDRISYDFKYGDQYGHGLNILAGTFEIELGLISTSEQSELEARNLFNSLVSTFKFTDQNQVSDSKAKLFLETMIRDLGLNSKMTATTKEVNTSSSTYRNEAKSKKMSGYSIFVPSGENFNYFYSRPFESDPFNNSESPSQSIYGFKNDSLVCINYQRTMTQNMQFEIFCADLNQ